MSTHKCDWNVTARVVGEETKLSGGIQLKGGDQAHARAIGQLVRRQGDKENGRGPFLEPQSKFSE